MIINAARHTMRVSYLIAGAIIIVLALCTIALRIGLPLVANQKSNIESRVSQYLKSPVEIGDLTLRWKGSGPLLFATDVAVRETDERAVKLDELLIEINIAQSLLRGIPIINELSLVGARLAVEAGDDGQFRLHGLEGIAANPSVARGGTSPSGSRGVDLAAWLFNARKVGLLNTQLTLIEQKTDRRFLIDELNIRAENNGEEHRLRVDAQLPTVLGGYLEAGIDLVGDAGALSDSKGDWYLSAESFNVGALTTLLHMSGFMKEQTEALRAFDASGSLEIWGGWQDGRLVSASGPLTLETIIDRTTGDTLLDSASAYLKLKNDTVETSLLATDIQANLGAELFQLSEIRINRSLSVVKPDRQAPSDELSDDAEPVMAASLDTDTQWQLTGRGKQVPLELSGRLAAIALSGLRPDLADELSNANIDGSIQGLVFDVSGSPDKPSVALEGDIRALSISGMPGIPAFGPLTGAVSIVDSVGTVELSAQQMPLGWPDDSDRQLQIDSLAATVDVDLSDLQRLLIGADIQLTDDGIDTNTSIKSTLVSGESPHLHIQSQFEAEDISRIAPWLPRKQLPPAATSWLEEAFVAGKATDGSLLFFGNISDFPFEDGEGVFRGSVKVEQAELLFLSDWPAAQNITADVELDGLSLTAISSNAELDQFNATKTQAVVGNLLLPVLEFSTTAQGKLQDLANFAVDGPLQSILKPVFEDVTGTGTTQMDLAITVPFFNEPAANGDALQLQTWKPFKIAGSVFLNDNDVSFDLADLVLEDTVGAVSFNENGVLINSLGGSLLGQPVKLTGATEGLGSAATTTIRIKGALEANDFLAHYGNPMDQFIRGASQWDITIAAPHSLPRLNDEGVRLTISSDLTGSSLLLPTPFDKGSSIARPFTLSTAFRGDADDQLWDVVYGDELRTRVKLVDDLLHSVLVELGDFDRSNSADLTMAPGIRLQGEVPSFAADGWIETIARYIDSFPASEGEPEPILPISVALNASHFILGQESFGNALMHVNTDDSHLNFSISNPSLYGNLRYPRRYWDKTTVLTAQIESMDWSVIDALASASEDTAVGSANSESLDPRLLPRVEARVSLLTRDDLRVRDLAIRTEPNVSGLDITTLGFAYDTMRLVGQGYWYLRDPQDVNSELAGKHSTQLNLVLQSDNFGVGFEELGLNDVIADAQGTVELKVNWPGPLYAPEIARLDGTGKMDIQSGSIIPFEPGAGRVVGLFALQSLPRRLNLDFKDLTQDGLAFKSIVGTAKINNGLVDVPLLQLTGPIGVVDIVGTSDLNTQEFDQKVTVLPRVSAALPIIGAISGGATAGIGVLVAAGVLKALGVDFDRVGLRTYSLTGKWTEPVLTPIAADFSLRRE